MTDKIIKNKSGISSAIPQRATLSPNGVTPWRLADSIWTKRTGIEVHESQKYRLVDCSLGQHPTESHT
jgi:type IV secretory pathway TrbF-like protein